MAKETKKNLLEQFKDENEARQYLVSLPNTLPKITKTRPQEIIEQCADLMDKFAELCTGKHVEAIFPALQFVIANSCAVLIRNKDFEFLRNAAQSYRDLSQVLFDVLNGRLFNIAKAKMI